MQIEHQENKLKKKRKGKKKKKEKKKEKENLVNKHLLLLNLGSCDHTTCYLILFSLI